MIDICRSRHIICVWQQHWLKLNKQQVSARRIAGLGFPDRSLHRKSLSSQSLFNSTASGDHTGFDLILHQVNHVADQDVHSRDAAESCFCSTPAKSTIEAKKYTKSWITAWKMLGHYPLRFVKLKIKCFLGCFSYNAISVWLAFLESHMDCNLHVAAKA